MNTVVIEDTVITTLPVENADSLNYYVDKKNIDPVWLKSDFDSATAVILNGDRSIMYDLKRMDKMYAPSSRRTLNAVQLASIVETLSGNAPRTYWPSDCFQPYHGFFFYKKGKIKARFAVCFSCGTYYSLPVQSGGIDYETAKNVFKALELPVYNWDDSTEMEKSKIKYSDYFKKLNCNAIKRIWLCWQQYNCIKELSYILFCFVRFKIMNLYKAFCMLYLFLLSALCLKRYTTMKKPALILLTAFIVFLLSSYNQSCCSIDLIQAIKDSRIRVAVASTGSHSGKCMQLKITNLSTMPLYLAIAPGTLFTPDDDGEQTILSLQNLPIVVQRSETKLVTVSGYCTELHDRCPSTASGFTISRNNNASLESLIQFMAPMKNLNDDLIQQSIWCVTDSQSAANISATADLNSKAIRAFLFKQKGQTDTWYSTTRVAEIAADRTIRNSAMEITGKIDIKAAKPMELISVVKNEAGEVVWKYPYRTSLPAGDLKFDFKLKVVNWKAGNYSIVYTCEGVELINQKFTI